MPRYDFVELFKHKEKICAVSKYSQEDVLENFYELIHYIEFFDENNISTTALSSA